MRFTLFLQGSLHLSFSVTPALGLHRDSYDIFDVISFCWSQTSHITHPSIIIPSQVTASHYSSLTVCAANSPLSSSYLLSSSIWWLPSHSLSHCHKFSSFLILSPPMKSSQILSQLSLALTILANTLTPFPRPSPHYPLLPFTSHSHSCSQRSSPSPTVSSTSMTSYPRYPLHLGGNFCCTDMWVRWSMSVLLTRQRLIQCSRRPSNSSLRLFKISSPGKFSQCISHRATIKPLEGLQAAWLKTPSARRSRKDLILSSVRVCYSVSAARVTKMLISLSLSHSHTFTLTLKSVTDFDNLKYIYNTIQTLLHFSPLHSPPLFSTLLCPSSSAPDRTDQIRAEQSCMLMHVESWSLSERILPLWLTSFC